MSRLVCACAEEVGDELRDLDRLLAAVRERAGCDHVGIMDFADVLRRRKAVRNYDGRARPARDARADRRARVARSRAAASARASGSSSSRTVRRGAGSPSSRTSPSTSRWASSRGSRAPPRTSSSATREDDYHDRYRAAGQAPGRRYGDRLAACRTGTSTRARSMMLLMLAAVDEGLGGGLFGVLRLGADLRSCSASRTTSRRSRSSRSASPRPSPRSSGSRKEPMRRRRKPLDEVVRWERW